MSETEAQAYPMTIEVRNPADGKVVGEVPIETAEAVAAKVRELRLFQPEWEAIGPKGRKAWLLTFQGFSGMHAAVQWALAEAVGGIAYHPERRAPSADRAPTRYRVSRRQN